MKRYGMILLMVIVMTNGMAMAAPVNEVYYNAPHPTGGTEALKRMVVYPTLARDAGIEGSVVLQFRVSTSGKIEDLKVVKSGGHILDAAATAAVTKVRWEPARYGEQAVNSAYQLPIEFRTSTR